VKRKSGYPFVRCDQDGHRPLLPGFVICLHIKDGGQPVDRIIPSSDGDLGQILCKDGLHETAVDGALICAYCAKARGWLPN
jgi:hypothetical protein